MEPATRILSHESTKSYLERELIVSLNNNGPMIGPSLEVMDSHHPNDDIDEAEGNEKIHSTSSSTTETGTMVERRRWWCKPKDDSDPKQFPRYKKNLILLVVSIAGSM
jgi:hypothetical protein